MAAGINKVILVGNLGRDPEIQRFDNGVKKASFSLATTEQYKGKDGEKASHTEWHNIILWRGLAEVAENYLKKGNTVYVEGRIRKREYQDKDGVKKFIYEIMGDVLQMLGSGGGTRREDSGAALPAEKEDSFMPPTPEDDLPF
ncbi:MAG: single-stranded DNA-binding protein [Bacteroidetes bacterium]|nr:single-stranded DNA-binding protein [Bacteroidota bacterium]